MADPGVPVQLTAQLMLGQTTGVVPLLWQYLGRRGRPISGYTWQDPGQVGIPNHFPSPASCYNVASGMDVHWLGLWKYTVVFWYVIDFQDQGCFVLLPTSQMIDLSILSVLWQTSFPSLGTFALCDGDFPRWDFYSGPRYGVVTAGGDTSRNARPGGGASLRVSTPFLGDVVARQTIARHPCLMWLCTWHF